MQLWVGCFLEYDYTECILVETIALAHLQQKNLGRWMCIKIERNLRIMINQLIKLYLSFLFFLWWHSWREDGVLYHCWASTDSWPVIVA